MDLLPLIGELPLLEPILEHGKAYLVGGAIRDFILGRPRLDFDLVVSQDPERWAESLRDAEGGRVVPLSEGEMRLVLSRTLWIDFARMRGDTIEEDLAERDFTVNSMAVDLENPDTLIDPHGGLEDLEAGALRSLSEANLEDDPLRLLRAFRFASTLRFRIEDRTFGWIRSNAERLEDPAKERVRHELMELLKGADVARTLNKMHEGRILLVLFPELKPMAGTQQIYFGKQDLLHHALRTVEELECVIRSLEDSGFAPYRDHIDPFLETDRKRAVLLLAALLHDLGKPETLSYDEEGKTHFLGHDKLSSTMTLGIARRLRFSKKDRTLLSTLARYHMYPHLLAREDEISARAVNRYHRKMGELDFPLLLLAYADAMATPPHEKGLEGHMELARTLHALLVEKKKKPKPRLVTGHDLIDLGLAPGPAFRRILDEIEDRAAEGEIGTRSEALELAKTLAETLKENG
jgi:tRNA nucleotidyltransferase/poly(A) polymerase